MRIAPAIAKLCDSAGQATAVAGAAMQSAVDRWRALPDIARMLEELARFGEGGGLQDYPALEAMMRQDADDPAKRLILELLRVQFFLPLAIVPLRHAGDEATGNLLIARRGRGLLLLVCREPGACDADKVVFGDGIRFETVLAGAAEGERVSLVTDSGSTPLQRERISLRARTQTSLDLSREALLVRKISKRLVTLRLERVAADPRPSRQFRLDDGVQQQAASGSSRESRQQLMLALLGRMQWHDAAPVMAEMAREGREHLRWHALRECLALDSGTGFRVLSEIAEDSLDPLCEPSRALRTRLLETYPVLARLEAA